MKKWAALCLCLASLPVAAGDSESLTLNWNVNQDDTKGGLDCQANAKCFGYNIYLGSHGQADPAQMVKVHTANAPPWTVRTLSGLELAGPQKVCFSLTAYNVYGESPFSNVVCEEIQPGKADAPTGFTIQRLP